MEAGAIVIDPDAHTVMVDGKEVFLTPREFELLLYLAQNKNLALTRQQILSAVWNFDYYGDARTVDTHVKNLHSLGSHVGNICGGEQYHHQHINQSLVLAVFSSKG